MKVLLAVSSLEPSYGGPAVSVAVLAQVLIESGIDAGIWAPNTSSAQLRNVQQGDVLALGGELRAVLERFGTPDLIHDSGVWLRHNHQLAVYARQSGVPRILSPRGMLSPWALRHKRIKKAVAWWAYQRRDVTTASRLHATSEAERSDLEALTLDLPIDVIPNAFRLQIEEDAPGRRDQVSNLLQRARTALFLGRVYPVKGLPLLIEAWARVRPPNWQLVVAGPDEGGHRLELENLVRSHGLQNEVLFSGAVDGATKAAYLHGAELFVLPSLSESFGIAIGEALASGTPVITTTAAPWSALIALGCGWWCSPTVDGLSAALASATAIEPDMLVEMGARGRLYVLREFEHKAIATSFNSAYEQALRRGPG